MKRSHAVRYLMPMTMDEILELQVRPDSNDKKAVAKWQRWQRRLRRIVFLIVLAFIYAAATMSVAAAVVGPQVLKAVANEFAAGKISSVAHLSRVIEDSSKRAEESSDSGSSSSSSSASSYVSSGSGRNGLAPTPEPSSLMLFAIAGVALGGLAIRRRRAARS